MSLVPFKQVFSSDRLLMELQGNTFASLYALNAIGMLDGVMIKDVALKMASNVVVNHGLGRMWQGFIITKKYAAVDAYAAPVAQQVNQASQLTLAATADATVDVWIF